MKQTFILITTVLILVLTTGCIKKQDANTATAETKTAAKPRNNGPQARAKAAQANRTEQGGMQNQNSAIDQKLVKKYNQPVNTDNNKGVFISEIAKFLSLTPAKNTELDNLIVKYKRKGQDFKFFGAFYANNKPFAKDLAKIFTPLEVEKFKHFHAYWFDRIPYPRPDMPVNLYYRLGLSKDQFVQVIDIYSNTSIAKAKQGKAAVNRGISQIDEILNAEQKAIYKELLSISKNQF